MPSFGELELASWGHGTPPPFPAVEVERAVDAPRCKVCGATDTALIAAAAREFASKTGESSVAPLTVSEANVLVLDLKRRVEALEARALGAGPREGE